MSGQAADRAKRIKDGIPVRVTGELGNRPRDIIGAINQRAYEIFEARGRMSGRDLDDWLQAESELLYPLRLDVEELDNTLIVKGEVHGFSTDEFEVKVEPRLLTIAGEHKQPEESPFKQTALPSPTALRIFRTLELPEEVMTEKAIARLRNGILEVTLPRVSKGAAHSSNAA
jgi:HSP20 family protein